MSDTLARDAAPVRDLSQYVGQTYVYPDYYEISREAIRDFARATQNYHPFHWDEEAAKAAGHPNIMAPLTFGSAFGIKIHERMYQSFGIVPGPMVQAEQRFSYQRPLYAGDRVHCEVEILSFRSSLGADISETKNILSVWETGEPILIGWTKLAGRTGSVLGEEIETLVDEVMMHGLPTV
ncbi:MAG: FAS1-like dehydratase domain-containing protein [Segniliparus sp.]|uniref:FAS1-like dehydratase domain-containing protein n=1 Tax=Segniliparus sp. TaxID=2804064 RepID=UPI003F32D0D2